MRLLTLILFLSSITPLLIAKPSESPSSSLPLTLQDVTAMRKKIKMIFDLSLKISDTSSQDDDGHKQYAMTANGKEERRWADRELRRLNDGFLPLSKLSYNTFIKTLLKWARYDAFSKKHVDVITDRFKMKKIYSPSIIQLCRLLEEHIDDTPDLPQQSVFLLKVLIADLIDIANDFS